MRKGTRRDAMLHSAGSNAFHGLQRSIADKRRAVQMLLKDEEWNRWSDREIARLAGVGKSFISKMRRRHQPESRGEQRLDRRGDQIYSLRPAARQAASNEAPSDYVQNWIYFLVRFTPRQFVVWQQVVNLRTDVAVLAKAVEVVMKTIPGE